MAKFAARSTLVRTPVRSTGRRQFTHEGGVGYERDAKSALFLLAASNMVSEDTFYERGDERDARFETLIHQVTAEDPAWVRGFVPYLRDTMQMRSASIVVAAEYVNAGGKRGRQLVNDACRRADEPGEMLAYWRSRYGRQLPQPIKRGVADAVRRLYTERNALKYDGANRPWRFADVIETVHPSPVAEWQSALFKYLLDERHNHDGEIGLGLPTLLADLVLRSAPEDDRRKLLGGEFWHAAGWSWERLAGWLPGGMDAAAWEAVIPNMGYMALLRNLRNFDQAGVCDAVAARVAEKLSDPDEVAKSRQFPIRFYSAFKNIGSLRWAPALEKALDLSLRNVPELPGRTLILIDLSPSMGPSYGGRMSANSSIYRYEIAMLFGAAVAKRSADPTLVVYSTPNTNISRQVQLPLLRLIEVGHEWMTADQRGGTHTFGTLSQHFNRHDRIIILTDEQAHDAGQYSLPDVPIYTFNLAGYAPGHLDSGSGKHHTFGGLTDAAFRLVPMLERDASTGWPFASVPVPDIEPLGRAVTRAA